MSSNNSQRRLSKYNIRWINIQYTYRIRIIPIEIYLFLIFLALEPIVYKKPGQWFSYSSHFIFNVTPQSDFDYIESFCIIDKNQTFPCLNLTEIHEECLTLLTYNGVLGCNYQCYFMTKKTNYSDEYSNDYLMHLCE
jgi:hypothetical protein